MLRIGFERNRFEHEKLNRGVHNGFKVNFPKNVATGFVLTSNECVRVCLKNHHTPHT